MAEGLNRVMLLGNLGADPELRVTGNGSAVLKLRLATTESYMDGNNTRQERTEWHSVTLWGKRGEALAKILAKGDRIFVEGRIQTSSYEKDNEKRYRTEIVATNVILNGKGAGQPQEQRREGRSGSPPPRTQSRAASSPDDDFGDYGGGGGFGEDIPFIRDETVFGGWDKP